MKIVIDNSVTVKWFLPEEGQEQARQLLEAARLGDVELHAPTLWLYELNHALSKSNISKSDYTKALKCVSSF